MANTNRTKGNNLERKVAKDLREIGFSFCKTSRQASRLLDDCQVDLAFVPFNIQCKNGYENSWPRAARIFTDMEGLLKKNYPQEDSIHGYPKIVIHHVQKKTYAYIEYDLLLKLLKNGKDKGLF